MYKSHKRFELITFIQNWNINIWIRKKLSIKMADQPSTSGHNKAKEKAIIAWHFFIYRALCFRIFFICITTIIITIQNGIQNTLSWKKSSVFLQFLWPYWPEVDGWPAILILNFGRIQMLIFQVWIKVINLNLLCCSYTSPLALHGKFHDRMKCRFLKNLFFLWGSIYGPLGINIFV